MRNRPRSWPKKSTRPIVKLKNITRKEWKNMPSARKNADIEKRNVVTKRKMIGVIERKIVGGYTKKVIVSETKKIDVAMIKPLVRPKSSTLTTTRNTLWLLRTLTW